MTPLLKSDVFEASHGLKNVYIKDESVNKTGTIKDRRNERVIQEAARLGVDKLVLITSGSNGYSLATLAKKANIKIVCIVEKEIDSKVFTKLSKVAYHVIPLNLSEKILRTEEIIAFARERDDEVIWDVTNGYEDAYYPIVKEILSEIPSPDFIVTPLGSGGIFVGVINALQTLKLGTKVIGLGPSTTQRSFADKLNTPWSPYAKAIENCKVFGHETFRLSENEIRRVYQLYQHVANTEPSSTIVFGAPDVYTFKSDETIIFLNSGKTKW